MSKALPARSEVDRRFTWKSEAIFADAEAWEAAVAGILAALPDLAEFKGHLGDSPDMLADWFEASEKVQRVMEKVRVYTNMEYSCDVGDQGAAARADRARSVSSQLHAAMSFAVPELIATGFPKLREWVASTPRLSHLGHHFERLEKLSSHVRPAEVEEVLAQVADPLNSALAVHGVFANTDMQFEAAIGVDGPEEVAQSTIGALLTSADRETRRSAYEHYADAHLAAKHALAANLGAGVKRDVFFARARRFTSSLEAALTPNHIPTDVFHNVIRTFRDNVGIWHRYWRLRQRALGQKPLKPYDTRAPLGSPIAVPYEQSVEWIAEGVSPLGDEYVKVLRRGALEDRWVDVYPNKGKRMGAFSTSSPDTPPFIFMSYNNDIYSMSTLAHELGHSMHSYYGERTQPFVYSNYGLFQPTTGSSRQRSRRTCTRR